MTDHYPFAVVSSRDTSDLDEFVEDLLDQLGRRGQAGLKAVTVVVHGYNTTHAEAINLFSLVSRSLGPRMDLSVEFVGFSWPSDGLLTRYLGDLGAARQAGEVLAAGLMEAARRRCAVELSVVAHSMGARVLAYATRALSEHHGDPATVNLLSEAVLVAPDLDADTFNPGRLGSEIPVWARRVTVYSNRLDRALLASSVKRAVTGRRLGRTGKAGADQPENVVVVDTTHVLREDVHCGYFTTAPVLDDMAAVLDGRDRDTLEGRLRVGWNEYRLKHGGAR